MPSRPARGVIGSEAKRGKRSSERTSAESPGLRSVDVILTLTPSSDPLQLDSSRNQRLLAAARGKTLFEQRRRSSSPPVLFCGGRRERRAQRRPQVERKATVTRSVMKCCAPSSRSKRLTRSARRALSISTEPRARIHSKLRQGLCESLVVAQRHLGGADNEPEL